MSPVIEARDLGKRYQLGVLGHELETFRELLMRLARVPLALMKRAPNRGSANSQVWALRDVSFDIAEGEVVGIIGRNGAGKSTLLKILSRITEPSEGLVMVRGRLASLLEVGTGFHPELTGRENVFLNGAILGMRKAEIRQRFDEIVAFAEIDKFLDTPVKRYSSGMYVRLAFAVAAHLEPEILVVDEVLAVGDIAFQKKCIGKMSEVSRGGRTVLFVSHNTGAIESLCTSAMVLEQGRVTFRGGVAEGIRQYVATAIGGTNRQDTHTFDLATAPSRPSGFDAKLKRVELYTNDNMPVAGGVPIGAALKVLVSIDFDKTGSDFDVVIGFETLFGQIVLTTGTFFEPNHPAIETVGEHQLALIIPSLTLIPGEYRLRIQLNTGGQPKDRVDDAARLTIVRANYYGTGAMPSTGTFVLEQHWMLV